ncbi:hypothetical protein AXG94_02645 [Pseudomonas corrugata]|nr:hypothetical protein AXG94_02645 [Pseudomonas corrugata]
MAQYMFTAKLDPSMSVQDASGINGGRIFHRLLDKQYEASGQLKLGKFFVFRTHYLWDAVGILLGRIAGCARPNDLAPFRLLREIHRSPLCVCVK